MSRVYHVAAAVLACQPCERVKSGQVRDVNITFGCPHVPIP
jgi:hypothetical protein